MPEQQESKQRNSGLQKTEKTNNWKKHNSKQRATGYQNLEYQNFIETQSKQVTRLRAFVLAAGLLQLGSAELPEG